ncbi:hypothetical protein MKX01_000839 [Papaver californicum]|nr:hypothetical protein MKX01_000839 [Papaver californicum]
MDEYDGTQVAAANNHYYQQEDAMVTMERANNNYEYYNSQELVAGQDQYLRDYNNQELLADNHQDQYVRDYHHRVPTDVQYPSELPPAAGFEYNNQELVADQEYYNPRELPPGFVFAPSDQDLLSYLKQKIEDPSRSFNFPCIPEAKVYECHPQQLLEGITEQSAYFFARRTKRYANGKRPTRTVEGHGYWRMSTKTQPVYAGNMQQARPSENKSITKTNWLMKEYHIADKELTLCRMYLNKP